MRRSTEPGVVRLPVSMLIVLSIAAMPARSQDCLPDTNGDGHPLFGSMVARGEVTYLITSIASGDVNSDGDIDAVTTHQSSSSGFPGVISVMLNEGDGMLANGTPIYLAINAAPRSVQLGRLDADAILDLVYAEESTDMVVILHGDGSGNFNPMGPGSYTVGNEPSSVIIADLNGDTFQDIAVLARLDDSVTVLFNNGSGIFTPAGDTYYAGDAPNSPGCASHARRMGPRMCAGDVEGDGDIDLAVPNNGGVSILRNNGSGVFEFPQFEWVTGAGNVWSVKLADLNGDNRGDLVCAVQALCDVWASVSLNAGDGTFPDSVAYDVDYLVNPGATHELMDVAIADLDADGDRDLVVGFAYRTMEVILLNNGTGEFGPTHPNLMWLDVCRNLGPIVLDDFDGNGRADLAVGRESGGPSILRVILNESNPSDGIPFQHHQRVPDLVNFAVSGTSVYPWFAPRGVALSDIDGDNSPDIIAVDTSWDDYETHLNVVRNPGNGNFESVTPSVYMLPHVVSTQDFNSGMSFTEVRAGDMNGDGANDLVVADSGRFLETNAGVRSYEGSSLWVVLNLNDGEGNFAEPVPYDTDELNDTKNQGTTDAALGDIDGDGDLDVAAINSSFPWLSSEGNPAPQTQCRLRIFRNSGNGTLVLDAGFPLNLAYTRWSASVSMGDLDNDGDLDLVANTGGESGVRIFHNNGAGAFTQVQAIAPYSVSETAVLADLNNDGFQDLGMTWHPVLSANAPDLAIYLNDGDGQFPTRTDFSFQTKANLLFSSDMNNDGLPDLVGRTLDSGDAAVWLTRLTPQLHFELGRYSGSWLLWRAAAGDLDNDGDLEIVSVSDFDANLSILKNRICSAQVLGDCDGSGVLNTNDIPCFVNALLGTDTNPPGGIARSDMNVSGTTNGLDTQLFVNALLGP